MRYENRNNPYFLFAFLLFIVLKILGQILNVDTTYNKIINNIASIVTVLYLVIRSRDRSKKVKALLLFVTVSTCIILFALYFDVINVENNGIILLFILSVPIVILLIMIGYKTLNQIIQYYKYK